MPASNEAPELQVGNNILDAAKLDFPEREICFNTKEMKQFTGVYHPIRSDFKTEAITGTRRTVLLTRPGESTTTSRPTNPQEKTP